MTTKMTVFSGDWDGDEFGNEWPIYYQLVVNSDYAGRNARTQIELWRTDDRGNGEFMGTMANMHAAMEVMHRMGDLTVTREIDEFVSWGDPSPQD